MFSIAYVVLLSPRLRAYSNRCAQLAVTADRELWGELEPEEEDEEEEESDEEEEEELFPSHAPPADGLETPSGTQSIVSTVPGGLETPEFLDIRKDREAGTESVESSIAGGPTAPKQLYQVIEERAVDVRGFMGSAIGYDVHGSGQQGPRVLGQEDRGVKVRLIHTSPSVPLWLTVSRACFLPFSAKPARSTCRSTRRSLPSCPRRTSPPGTRPTGPQRPRSEVSGTRTCRMCSSRRVASGRREVQRARTRRRAGVGTTRRSSRSEQPHICHHGAFLSDLGVFLACREVLSLLWLVRDVADGGEPGERRCSETRGLVLLILMFE